MMLTRLFAIAVLSGIMIPGFPQQDQEAREILDKFAKKAESSYPFEMQFEYRYESQPDEVTTTDRGSILIDRKKFRLIMKKMEIYCNGDTFWNYLTRQNEVYISDPADAQNQDEVILSNPSAIFTMYREDFKYRFNGEQDSGGTTAYEIDLFPYDIEKPYHTVKLLIEKKSHRLLSMQTFEKQGIINTFTVTGFESSKKTDPGTFVFRPGDHPGIEVVDTRF